jgi:fructose-bisphosphate aldolase class I
MTNNSTPTYAPQFEKMKTGKGFVAALDQSGGSTPKALSLYGLSEDNYPTEAAMFDRIHEMRSRIITSPAFTGTRVVGAILFEMTMERQVEGMGAAEYLWQKKNVIPFLKVDNGLAEEANGVQLMKSIPELGDRLARANGHEVFGTKMRSVIKTDNQAGVDEVVAQQFAIGNEILDAGLVPIIEPEVDIKSPRKAESEVMLKAALNEALDSVPAGKVVMFKLSLPSVAGFYSEFVSHPKVLRVVALSGGYSRDEANRLLAENPGVIASFSRALTEGLSAQQSDAEFNATLDATIQSIYDASIT